MPQPRGHRPTLPMLGALLLILLTAGTALGMPLARHPGHPAPRVTLQVATIAGVEGDDACALLTEADLLRATGARKVLARTPGTQQSAPAGCEIELQPRGDANGTWKVRVGVQTTGGVARLDQEVAAGAVLQAAGIGDRAVESTVVGSWSAVKGDVYVRVSVLALDGDPPRPPEDMGRLLIFRIMSGLHPGPTGPASSLSPSPEPESRARTLVERLRGVGFGQDQVDAAVEILARSGIPTYRNPDDAEPLVPVTEPASPMSLLADQVRAMALEAWAGGGFSGADLAALAPAPQGDLADGAEELAGYVAAVATDGAEVARGLMGDIDWTRPQQAVFPQLVLTLMASDIARDQLASVVASGQVMPATAQRSAVGGKSALAATAIGFTAVGGACSVVTGFIDGAIASVFAALKATAPNGGPGRVIVTIWNFVVSVAEAAGRAIVKELTQRVHDVIATVAGTVGLAATIVSAVRPWAVAVSSVPPVTAKGTPGQPGQMIVRVDLGGLDDWPAIVKDCAAGHSLPSLKPEGAPVTWSAITQAPIPLVSEGNKASRLDADGVARFDFTTLTEDVSPPWDEESGRISVTVTVERTELNKVRELVSDQLLGALPPIARGPVGAFVRPIIDSVSAQLDHLVSTQASGSGWVIYHTPKRTPDPKASSPAPATQRAVMVRLERPARVGELPETIIELYSCGGPYGDWSGVFRVGGIVADKFVALAVALPIAFHFPGASGVQSATAPFAGDVPSNVPTLTAHVEGALNAVVDGRTMTLSGRMTSQGSVVPISTGAQRGTLGRLPIEPAPAGTCP